MTVKGFRSYFLILISVILITSCKTYKQDILFKTNKNFSESDLTIATAQAERNYVLQANDLISLDVYTNKGERIVDPNNELTQNNRQNTQIREELIYLVKTDGTVKLPIVGQIDLDSLTLDQAEKLLQIKYDEFYKDSFVKLQYENKRVVVLGAMGGQVIPMTNENLNLLEILALSGGFEIGAKSQNIKVIRGDLSNPEVFQVNLSTIDGMRKSMLVIEPGDIIYVEPWRRPWVEALKDVAPVLNIVSSTLTIIFLALNFK